MLIGIDGCRGGWVVAKSDAALLKVQFSIEPELSRLFEDAEKGAARLVIDIPIGLAERGARRCDLEARRILQPPRASSVFPAPIRPLLSAATYEEACRLSRVARGNLSSGGISKQLFHILPKIREVDALVTPERQAWIREGHPELVFAGLSGTGRGLAESKKRAAGERLRLSLLENFVGPIDLASVRAGLGRDRVARDDLVDALACLVAALRLERGEARVLPQGAVDLDAQGLRMEIVF